VPAAVPALVRSCERRLRCERCEPVRPANGIPTDKPVDSHGQASRSVLGRKQVTQVTVIPFGRWLGGLVAEQQTPAQILEEPNEVGSSDREDRGSEQVMDSPRMNSVGWLRSMEALAVQVGFPHDLREPPQHGVAELIAAQD
jgi:hypothetical protein